MKEVEVPGFMMYYEWREDFSQMTPEETQIIVMAAFNGFKEETISNDRFVQSVYLKIKVATERGNAAYVKKVTASRENGKKGGRPRKNPPMANIIEVPAEEQKYFQEEPDNYEEDIYNIGPIQDCYMAHREIFSSTNFSTALANSPEVFSKLRMNYDIELLKDVYNMMKPKYVNK